jgi:hypothetical protein
VDRLLLVSSNDPARALAQHTAVVATATHGDYAAAAVGRATRREVQYRSVSFDEHLALLLGSGVPRGLAEVYVANYRAIAAARFADTSGDLRALIGPADDDAGGVGRRHSPRAVSGRPP